MKINQHHYIERDTGQVCSERPIGDWIVNYLYSKRREEVPFVYQLLGSQWFSGFLGWVNYDFPLGQSIPGIRRFLKNCAINLNECLDKPEELDSARKIFERRIRYWQWRPMSRRSVGGCFPLRFATSNRLLQRHVYTFSEGEILRVRRTPRFEQDFMAPRVSRR